MRDKLIAGKFNSIIISTLIRNKSDLNFRVVNLRVRCCGVYAVCMLSHA